MSAPSSQARNEPARSEPPAESGSPLLAAGIAVILLASLALRFLWLDRLPGINGDEAYFPVQIQRGLAGEPFTLRAPTGLFVDPLTVLSEGALLLVFPPSFWILRLPVALWALVGIAFAFVLHARLHGNRREAWLVAALMACLPLHLAYSRCGWVPSLMLATAPLVWYPAQEIAEGRGGRKAAALLAIGSILSLLVHLTTGAFLLAVALALAWTRRADVGRRLAALAGLGLLAAGVFVALSGAAGFQLGRAGAAAAETGRLLAHPLEALAYIALAGRFLWGSRAFAYFAGSPETALQDVLAVATILATLVCAWRLLRGARPADRFAGAFWLLVPLVLLGTKGLTGLQIEGRERYVLWLLVAFPPLVVRGLVHWTGGARAALAVLVVCGVLLIQTWAGYFAPLQAQTWASSRLHPTFWTGEREPKAEAARTIRELSERPDSLVYVENFWLHYPLQFLLGPEREVRTRIPQAALSSPREWFAVGFEGSPFTEAVRRALGDAGKPFEERTIHGPTRPILSVIHRPAPRNE